MWLQNRKFRLILGIVSVIGAIFFFNKALDIHKNTDGSEKWPYVEGKVIKSKPAGLVRKRRGTMPILYGVDIRYTYGVNGLEYTSDVVLIGGVTPADSSEIYERYLERYPKGSIVKVYYNPARPENAVLESGVMGDKIIIYYPFTLILAAL